MLRLGLVAVMVDRPQVARIVCSAARDGQDVVDLVRLADPPEPGAVIAPAQVLVPLEDLAPQATPRPTSSARTLTCRPGLGLLGCQVGMTIAVAIGIAVQCATARGTAWALGP